MKKLAILLGVLSLMALPYKGISQKYKNREITLIQFNVTIQPEIKKQLDQLESKFPETKNKNIDPIIAKIKEESWELIFEKLQHDVGMLVMPINTLGDQISYDVYGFPDVGITKAQKKGATKYYMKVDLQIGPELYQYATSTSKDKKENTPQRVILNSDEIKPVVTITLTTFPTNGIIPLNKYIGSIVAPNVLKVDASILDGLVNDTIKNDKSTLMSLIAATVEELTLSILTD